MDKKEHISDVLIKIKQKHLPDRLLTSDTGSVEFGEKIGINPIRVSRCIRKLLTLNDKELEILTSISNYSLEYLKEINYEDPQYLRQ